MKAAFLAAREKIDIRDVPVPSPGEGEVLVRVKHVGVCGSDVHYFLRGRIGDQVVKYPFILGHEAAGVVEQIGKGVDGLKEGDGVAIEPAVPCGDCRICSRGKPNLCRQVKFLGTPPVHGAYREYMVMPGDNLFPLPDGAGTDKGALVEPLAVGLYAVELAGPLPGETVAVFGCGPIGLSVIIFASLAGAGTIIASERIEARIAFAQRMGADLVINADGSDAVEEIMNATGKEGVDTAFEAAGEPETLIQCVNSSTLCGRVLMVGIPDVDFWQIPSTVARKRELVLQNVRRSAFTAEKVLSLLEKGRIDVEGMITHRFPLDRIEEAFDLVSGYRDGVVKAMIEL